MPATTTVWVDASVHQPTKTAIGAYAIADEKPRCIDLSNDGTCYNSTNAEVMILYLSVRACLSSGFAGPYTFISDCTSAVEVVHRAQRNSIRRGNRQFHAWAVATAKLLELLPESRVVWAPRGGNKAHVCASRKCGEIVSSKPGKKKKPSLARIVAKGGHR